MSMAVAEGEGPPSHHAPTEQWCLLAGSCQPAASQERDDARHILVGRPIYRRQPNPRTLDEYTPHQNWSANFIFSSVRGGDD